MKAALLVTSALTLSTFGAGTAAMAQDQGTATAAPAAQTDSTATERTEGLADIVVTAQRRSENLQRVPIAVSAVSGEALITAGITQPAQLSGVVPSLQSYTSVGPYALFYLRGIGTFNGNTLSDSPIAFNFGGVYIARASTISGYFYDLERLEVVKGPQGTLYGRNATGGAINVLPATPHMNELSGSLRAEYGNYNTVRTEGVINLPVSESVALRAAAFYNRHDAYMSDGTDDQDDYGGRITARLEPTDTFSLTVMGYYSHQGGRGVGGTVIGLDEDARNGLGSPVEQAFYRSQRNSVAGRNFDGLRSDLMFQDNSQWGVTATAQLETPAGTITVIPAYRHAKLNYLSNSPGFTFGDVQTQKQFSLEARLASGTDQPLRYILGAFYFDARDQGVTLTNGQSQIAFQNLDSRTKSMATFADLTYAISDNFRATVGGRYTTEDKSFFGDFPTATLLCPGAISPPFAGTCPNLAYFPIGAQMPASLTFPGVTGNAIPVFDPTTGTLLTGTRTINRNTLSDENFSYRFALDWDVTPRNLLYASYATGYKSGGFYFAAGNNTYNPETIKAWTIGSKNRFFDNKVQLNAEAFYWKYSNQQVSHLSQDNTGATVFATENVGKSTFKGVEIESVFLVTPNTRLTADAQYLDAVYDRFQYNVPITLFHATGCATSIQSSVVQLDCSNRRPVNAPKWTLNLGAEQTIPLGNGARVLVGGRLHYQSGTAVGLDFTSADYQKGYTMGDAYLRYTAPNDAYYLEGYANNIGDKTVVQTTFVPPFAGFTVGSLKPPRTYGIRAGLKF